MKKLALLVAVALVATGAALAAVAGTSSGHSAATSSLAGQYVQAAKWWQSHRASPAVPPTTATLMQQYVQAAKLGYR